MKKIMITLAMIITLATGVFAANTEIKPEVLQAFNHRFAQAENVIWQEGENFYKASFIFHGGAMNAYYDKEAKLIGVTRYISSTLLPLYLQNSLRKNYPGYWITDLFEMSKKKGFSYYMTIRNADNGIVLKSESGSDWEVYQKQNL